jgi:hypothetical protein
MRRRKVPFKPTIDEVTRVLELGAKKGYFIKHADGRYSINPSVPLKPDDPDMIALDEAIARNHKPDLN